MEGEVRVVGTPFQKGNPGKQPGTRNKITRTVKEVFLQVFLDEEQNHQHNLLAFKRKYPRDFYALASKLIPTEVAGSVNIDVNWTEDKTYELKNGEIVD